MEGPFPPYQGDDAYVFVSYSHEDADAVFAGLGPLHEQGFRIWYDDGIHPGHNWPETLANKILNSGLFLFFASARSSESNHCQRELHFAMDGDLPILVVHLDDKPLPTAVKFVLGSQQAIMRGELSEDRYLEQLAEGVRQHVEPASTAAPARKPLERFDSRRLISIAVMPFSSPANNEELAALADFCTEEMGILLGVNENMSVASRSMVARQAAIDPDIVSLGEKLGVGYVIEGSLRRVGDKNQLSAELIETETGTNVWNTRMEVESSGGEGYLGAALDRLRARALDEMQLKLLAAIEEIEDDRLDATALCVRAEAENPFVAGGARRQELLEKAIALEPRNPWPHALLAGLHSMRIGQGFTRAPAEDTAAFTTHMEAALRYGNNRPPVLGVCAGACRMTGDHERGLELARRCLGLANSTALPAKMTLMFALASTGRADELFEMATEVDASTPPGYPRPDQSFQYCYMLREDWEQALVYSARAVANASNHVSLLHYACILAELDRIDEARASMEKARQHLPKLKLRSAVAGFRRTFPMPQFYRGLEKLVDLGVE